MRWIVKGLVAVVLIAALLGNLCFYKGVSDSLHAEHVLHAALLTVQLLDDYVASHGGEWPKSWANLEDLPPREWGMFEWPKDSHEVQTYVEVDFTADPKELAKQTPVEFDAVRPIGPYYPFKERWQVEALLETLRAHISRNEQV
jgi:hypothetical protein